MNVTEFRQSRVTNKRKTRFTTLETCCFRGSFRSKLNKTVLPQSLPPATSSKRLKESHDYKSDLITCLVFRFLVHPSKFRYKLSLWNFRARIFVRFSSPFRSVNQIPTHCSVQYSWPLSFSTFESAHSLKTLSSGHNACAPKNCHFLFSFYTGFKVQFVAPFPLLRFPLSLTTSRFDKKSFEAWIITPPIFLRVRGLLEVLPLVNITLCFEVICYHFVSTLVCFSSLY